MVALVLGEKLQQLIGTANQAGLVFAKCGEDLKNWIIKNNLPVSSDGKRVRMIKVVQKDGTSQNFNRQTRARARYEVGKETHAEDYAAHNRCGQGLHFAETKSHGCSLSGISSYNAKSLVVDVDLDTAVLVEREKVKARSCFVLFEGTEKDLVPRIPKAYRWV